MHVSLQHVGEAHRSFSKPFWVLFLKVAIICRYVTTPFYFHWKFMHTKKQGIQGSIANGKCPNYKVTNKQNDKLHLCMWQLINLVVTWFRGSITSVESLFYVLCQHIWGVCQALQLRVSKVETFALLLWRTVCQAHLIFMNQLKMCSIKLYSKQPQAKKQVSKHIHACVQNSLASVRLAQAHPN